MPTTHTPKTVFARMYVDPRTKRWFGRSINKNAQLVDLVPTTTANGQFPDLKEGGVYVVKPDIEVGKGTELCTIIGPVPTVLRDVTLTYDRIASRWSGKVIIHGVTFVVAPDKHDGSMDGITSANPVRVDGTVTHIDVDTRRNVTHIINIGKIAKTITPTQLRKAKRDGHVVPVRKHH